MLPVLYVKTLFPSTGRHYEPEGDLQSPLHLQVSEYGISRFYQLCQGHPRGSDWGCLLGFYLLQLTLFMALKLSCKFASRRWAEGSLSSPGLSSRRYPPGVTPMCCDKFCWQKVKSCLKKCSCNSRKIHCVFQVEFPAPVYEVCLEVWGGNPAGPSLWRLPEPEVSGKFHIHPLSPCVNIGTTLKLMVLKQTR